MFAILAVIIDSIYTINKKGETSSLVLVNLATYGYCFGKMNISTENIGLIPGIYSATGDKSKFTPIHLAALSLHSIQTLAIAVLGVLAYGNGL